MRNVWRGSLIVPLCGVLFAEPSGRLSTDTTVADIALPEEARLSRAFPTRLRRTHDLFRLFVEGAGEWRPAAPGRAPVGHPLPWDVAAGRQEAARIVSWPGADSADDEEGMLAIVLRDGERWCTPPLDTRLGSRLRFEAVRLDGTPVLEVELGAFRARVDVRPSAPVPLAFESQTDLALEPGSGSVCIGSRGGSTRVGEPRVLAPAPAGDRPDWVALLVLDDVRGDAISERRDGRALPALAGLAESGRVFRRAVSVGSHTLAAMASLQTGRDPVSIEPASTPQLRGGGVPQAIGQAPRPNIALSWRLQEAGYHPVFLGNNAYFSGTGAFARYSVQGDRVSGTVDNVRRLGPLLSRYADEGVVLLFWLTTAHAGAAVPRRLYDALGCGGLRDLDEKRCAYDARLRHLDEAIAAFEAGLSAAGLQDRTLQVLASDHGEQFRDGAPYEHLFPSASWTRADEQHGHTTDWTVLHVPLVFKGPGIRPGVSDERVSNLDVVPTVQSLLGLPAVSRLDGQPLPLEGGAAASGRRRLVSYGFCGHADDDGRDRLLWWDAACGPRRRAQTHEPVDYATELWRGGELVATDSSPSPRLVEAKAAHARWILDRLPAEALVLDGAGLGPGRVRVSVSVSGGRIVDWGPVGAAYGLDRILSARLVGESRLELELDGYTGRFRVETRPALARVSVEATVAGAPPVFFVGARQLPLDARGREMDPSALPALFLAADVPARRSTDVPSLRLWWQSPTSGDRARAGGAGIANIERVLRAWGYIR
jgi:hypothetical protein